MNHHSIRNLTVPGYKPSEPVSLRAVCSNCRVEMVHLHAIPYDLRMLDVLVAFLTQRIDEVGLRGWGCDDAPLAFIVGKDPDGVPEEDWRRVVPELEEHLVPEMRELLADIRRARAATLN